MGAGPLSEYAPRTAPSMRLEAVVDAIGDAVIFDVEESCKLPIASLCSRVPRSVA
jgi:hypothetical protein